MHKQDKTRRQKSQDSNTTVRHKCRSNKDHARKPKHQSKSAAHVSRYTKMTKRRTAESLQVAVMMTATGGTQNASDTHFEAQYADAPEKDLMQMCKHANVLRSCCNHALNYRAITYSGTIDLNTKREETIVSITPTGVVVNSRTFQTGSRTLAQIMTCIHHFQAAAVNG